VFVNYFFLVKNPKTFFLFFLFGIRVTNVSGFSGLCIQDKDREGLIIEVAIDRLQRMAS
jgi:hypothetical protein